MGDFALTDSKDIEKLEAELENDETEKVAELKQIIVSKKLPSLSWLKRQGVIEEGF